MFYISSPKINATNPNCVIKTDIVCNRERPSITFQFIPQVQGKNKDLFTSLNLKFLLVEAEKLKTVKIEVENLSILELLKITNEHITARAPKEEAVSSLKTKSEKKAVGKKR